MAKKQTLVDKIINILGSVWFFRAVVIFFVFEALWVAFSNRYPMAFDEHYHLGVIQLYANHLSPFWSSQPEGANSFGAIFRDASYLYHFLFGWIYNLIALFTDSQTIQVLIMRVMNIGIFVWAFYVYRKLLGAMGASSAMSNVLLLIFALIPVSSLLAGQINYDNLFIPLVGLLMLWTIEFDRKLKLTKKADAGLFIKITCLGMLGSLVKYAYLPFFVAAVIYMVLSLSWNYRLNIRAFGDDLLSSFKKIAPKTKWLLVAVLFVSLVLSFERYGLNIINYKTPVPDCAQVMTYNECKKFGPWIRDYELAQRDINFTPDPVKYFLNDWLYGMWFRLFFMVDGPDTQFQTRGPLTLPSYAFIALCAGALVASVLMGHRLWRLYGYSIGIPIFMSLFYAFVLWSNGFKSFAETGKPVAINGRYLLPVILPLLVVGAMALALILKRHDKIKVGIVGISLVFLVWGGGFLTFALRSNDAWYWNNTAVRNVNGAVQDTLGPIVPGYDKPTQFQR